MISGLRGRQSLTVLSGFALFATVVAALGVHWLVTILAFASITFLAAIQPPVVVALVVLSVPVQSELTFPFVLGEITMTQLLLFALIAGWGMLFWKRRIWLDSVLVGFLLVLAAYVVSFIAVDSPGNWFQETYRWAVAGVFYLICRSVITSWLHVRLVLWAIIVGVISVSLLALIQSVGGFGSSIFLIGRSGRVDATFGTPNTLAAYLEMSIPLFLACIPLAWWGNDTGRFTTTQKLLIAIAPLGGLLIVGLTQSRGGWVGIAAGVIFLWVHLPSGLRIMTALTSLILFGGFLLMPPGQSQLERFGALSDETSREVEIDGSRSLYEVGARRGALWSTAGVMIADKPLTGIGAGEFDENYREYVPSWIDRFPRGQAHNVWLQMGAQAGIWGILAYAWWWTASVWSIFAARRRVTDRTQFWIITGVLAVFVAYTLHSLVDYLNVLSLGLQLSVLTAIALNMAPEPLARYSEKEASASPLIAPVPAPCPK